MNFIKFFILLILYINLNCSYAQTPNILTDKGFFGSSVSACKDYCIIGAWTSAIIYKKIGQNWQQQIELKPNGVVYTNYFGRYVSISDGIALVSSIEDGKLLAYVYVLNNDKWNYETKLTANSNEENRGFSSFSLYENTAIMGISVDNGKGAAYIFIRNNDNEWYQQAKLTANDADPSNSFGSSVSIYQDLAIIGSPTHVGSAYFFVRNNDNVWKQVDKVTDENQSNSLFFGSTVDISKNVAVVTSRSYAYIYEYANKTWEQKYKIKINNREFNRIEAAISEKVALIGLPNTGENGSVYVFKKDKEWVEKVQLMAIKGENPPDSKSQFGSSLSVTDDFLFVNSPSQRRVYIYPIDIVSPVISGYVSDSDNNPVDNVKVSVRCSDFLINEVNTDLNGYYEFTVPHGLDGNVYVYKKDYILNPKFRTYEDVTTNRTNNNYIIDLFSISGFINDVTEKPLSGIEIKFNNDGGSAFTNSKGFFFHKLYHNWSGQAEPTGRGYRFINNDYSNSSYSYNNLSQNKTDQNFSAYKHILFGYVKDHQGNPIPNVTLNLSNIIEPAITDASGYYSIDIDYQWSGTITPHLQNYVFDPLSISYTNINCDQPNQSFIGIKTLPNFFVSPNTLHLSSKSGFALITVTTNDNPSSWSVSNLEIDWVSITKLHHNILISYEDNLNNSERNAVLAITHNNTIHNIEIIQAGKVDSNKPSWSVDQTNFRYQAMVTAIIQDKNNNVFDSENDLLAAFVDNECRGVASPLPVSNGKRFFLQVWSNENSENMNFKFFDSTNNKIYNRVLFDVHFIPDFEYGTIVSPAVLKVKQPYHIPDANNDGKVDIIDAVDVLKYITNFQ